MIGDRGLQYATSHIFIDREFSQKFITQSGNVDDDCATAFAFFLFNWYIILDVWTRHFVTPGRQNRQAIAVLCIKLEALVLLLLRENQHILRCLLNFSEPFGLHVGMKCSVLLLHSVLSDSGEKTQQITSSLSIYVNGTTV